MAIKLCGGHREFVLIAILAAVLLVGSPANAAGRALVYQRYDVKMTLNKDTSIDVVETQQVAWSGDWNGLQRDYDLQGGAKIKILGVSENGREYRHGSVSSKGGYIIERKRGNVNVKWRSRNVNERPYNNAQTTFEIRYRLTGAIGTCTRMKESYHDKTGE